MEFEVEEEFGVVQLSSRKRPNSLDPSGNLSGVGHTNALYMHSISIHINYIPMIYTTLGVVSGYSRISQKKCQSPVPLDCLGLGLWCR